MENEMPFDRKLDEVFQAYCTLKQQDDEYEKAGKLDEWWRLYFRAQYNLSKILPTSEVYAYVNVEFYDNVAQCAFRRGQAIDIADYIAKRKIAFRPLYIREVFASEREMWTIPLGVEADDIEAILKAKSPSLKIPKGAKILKLPLDALYEFGVKDTPEEDRLAFTLYGKADAHFLFDVDFYRLMASEGYDLNAFVNHLKILKMPEEVYSSLLEDKELKVAKS